MLLAGVWLGRSSRLRRRRRGWLALCALAIGVAIASYPLSVGVVADRRSGSCQQLDAAHYVVTIDPITHACTRLSRGGRTITTYTQAKRLAWRAFIQHPWIGVGFRGFAQYAVQQFEQVHQAPGSYYRQPHGIYHGLPAKHGVAGLLAWLLIVGALIRGWRGRAWDWCVAALLVIGLHLDVDRLREFWVAWGLLAAEQWGNAKPWWRSKQTAVR